MSLLSIRHVTKRFGGLTALSDVSLDVQEGEIRGLIGPNGSGKSTFFNVVSGVFRADAGHVLLNEAPLDALSADRRQGLGLARTFQQIELFYDMSVLENVLIGAHRLGRAGVAGALLRMPRVRAEEVRLRDIAEECLVFMGLAALRGETARDISMGISGGWRLRGRWRASRGFGPLDEPAAGMNPTETRALMAQIERIVERGITVLLVEHNMRMVMGLCPRITGAAPRAGDCGRDAGGDPGERAGGGSVSGAGSRLMLDVVDLHVAYGPIRVLKGVSLSVAAGTITALIGTNGAGKTTTLNAISGLLRPTSGQILFQGERIDGRAPEAVVRIGVVHVPEGRRVFRNLTVHECLRVGGYSRADQAAARDDIARMYELFPRLAERRRQLAGDVVGRGAADAGVRAGAGGEADAVIARRAIDGAVAEDRGGAGAADGGYPGAGDNDFAGGAERGAGAGDRGFWVCDRDGGSDDGGCGAGVAGE